MLQEIKGILYKAACIIHTYSASCIYTLYNAYYTVRQYCGGVWAQAYRVRCVPVSLVRLCSSSIHAIYTYAVVCAWSYRIAC